jgi:WD40-like Beta Propeller Repeat
MTHGGGGAVTPLEDRVRDAIRAKAAEVPPGSVPPLRLPARRRSPFSFTHGGRERPGGPAARARAGRAWAAPLAAAAGVAAALAVLFALTGVIHSGRSANGHPSGLAALPRYYVALTFTSDEPFGGYGELSTPQTRAVVRATATGRALATVTPPWPYGTFAGITAAAGDRTFVVAAQKLVRIPRDGPVTVPATKFFLLRLGPGLGRPVGRVTLTPLPIPAIPAGTEVGDFAISPDGSRLAVVSGRKERPKLNVYDKQKLSVYNLHAGTERTYRSGSVGNAPGVPITWITQNSLSWGTDNRTLAFVYGAWNGREGVRFLDTDRPGSGLLANSRVAVPQSRTTTWAQVQLTADGQTIIGNVDNPYVNGSLEHLVQVSAQTGKIVRVIHVTRGMADDVVQVHWMSPSGRVLIVTDLLRARHHSTAQYADVDAGMLVDGRYTPLPWSENTLTAAW